MESKQTTTKDGKKTKVSKQVKQPQAQPEQQVTPEQPVKPETESQVTPEPEQKEIRLVDIAVENENVALNVMVGFLNLAHKRGAFTIDESSKIWECILKFQKN